MAIRQTLEQGRTESFMHVIARDFQWLLRGLCVLLLIGTAVAMVVFWYAAIPLVLLLVLCYALLVIADGVEQRTTDEPTAAPRIRVDAAAAAAQVRQAAEAERAIEQRRRLEPRLTRIALEVLAGALVLGAVGAGLAIGAFGWKLLPIALLVLTGYAILVTTPMWLAWMEDDVDETSTEPQMKAPAEEPQT